MKPWLRRLTDLEAHACRRATRAAGHPWLLRLFAIVSRLGDGMFWYCLMLVMAATGGWYGTMAALHMLITSGVALLLYKTIKSHTQRVRPCHYRLDIAASVPPLDHYSFPSGHTLHAVSFTTVALWYYPSLAWLLVPFTLLVAASRVVLGLHYPSDVLVAFALGLGLAWLSLWPVN